MYAAASCVTLRVIVSCGAPSPRSRDLPAFPPALSAASFSGALEGSPPGSPPIRTGLAAPRLVAGAMAATWLA